MKDRAGNKVNKGDVLLEIGRGGSFGNDRAYSIKLWEMPKENKGEGLEYRISGQQSSYWWASLKNSYKIDKNMFNDSFWFSFYHGMSDLNTSIEDGGVKELINNSDWKKRKVSKASVKQYEKRTLMKIESIEDIFKNIVELNKDGHVPHDLMDSVLNVAKMDKTNPDFGNYKGEIGLAYLYDSMNYQRIIESCTNQLQQKLL